MKSLLLFLLVLVPMLVGLPLLGVWADPDLAVADYLEFPPLTLHVHHAPFSLAVFAAMAAGILLVVAPPLVRWAWASVPQGSRAATRPLPWWGWLGCALGATAWVLAWTRFPWFAPWQQHTFTPLWIAYILVVNALAWKRSGHCMLVDRPWFLAALFPFSAGFWWFFEYLNRFVQNWYYVGISDFTPQVYFWFATLAFSTVLPAVLGTQEWLLTFPRFRAAFASTAPLRLSRLRAWGCLLLAVAGLTLAGLGVWPSVLFPLLWISPLMVLLGVQLLAGSPSLLEDPARGDWSGWVTAALAALVCGWFWEMWNWQSLAQWIYSVPYVHKGLIFEMPILGFAGYLPFGIECLALAELVRGALPRTVAAAEKPAHSKAPHRATA